MRARPAPARRSSRPATASSAGRTPPAPTWTTTTFTIAPSTNEWVTVSAALGQTYTGSTHTANFNISDLTFYQINGNNSHTTLPSTSNNSAGLLYYPTAALAPGLYGFTVAGNTVGGKGGSYSGTLSLTPVPEPAGYALLTVGLGILGLTARRQRNDKLG